MNVEITEKNVVITLPRVNRMSAKGTSILLASENGKSGVKLGDGREVRLNCNVYVEATDTEKAKAAALGTPTGKAAKTPASLI